MKRGNLWCEAENCGQSAVAFGIKGTDKTRSCRDHLASLLDKGMHISDIDGYSFIESHREVAEFEERKTAVARGRTNLTALEASCESELAEALQAIEQVKRNVLVSVEDRFEEMKAVVTAACRAVKSQLCELENNLESYLTRKEKQLSRSGQSLCKVINLTPRLLRAGIADVSDRISAVLSESWMVSTTDIHSTLKCLDVTQKKEAVNCALAEAMDYAKKGIPEALLYAHLLIGEEDTHNQAKEQVCAEVLKGEKMRVEENLKWLKHSWDLTQRYVLPVSMTVRVGHQLAVLLSRQLSQFSTAEEMLQYCYKTAQEQNPQAEELLSLCTDICAVYYDSKQYEKLEELGQWTLQAFAAMGLPGEYFWIVLFYLSDSMRSQGKHAEIDAILNECWKLPAGNKLEEMLRLLTRATEPFCKGSQAAAEKLLVQAWRIGTYLFPTSVFTALTTARLSAVISKGSREQLYRQVQSIYAVAAPMSPDAGANLDSLGLLLYNAQRWKEAEECYRQARSIYAVAAPKSAQAATNLDGLGLLLYNTQRMREAEECFAQARSIRGVPLESASTANSVARMGDLFVAIKRKS